MNMITKENRKISAAISVVLEITTLVLGMSGITPTTWWHYIVFVSAVVVLYGFLFVAVSILLNLYDKYFLRLDYQINIPNHMTALQELIEKIEIRFSLLSHPSDPIFTVLEKEYIYRLAEKAHGKALVILDDIQNGRSNYDCSKEGIEQVQNYMFYFRQIMDKCSR